MSTAKQHDDALVDVYYRWNKMYLFSQKEYFLESDLEEFKVLSNLLVFCIYYLCN